MYNIYLFYDLRDGLEPITFLLVDDSFESVVKRLEEYYNFEYGDEEGVKYFIQEEGYADYNSPAKVYIIESYEDDENYVFDEFRVECLKLDLKMIKEF